MKSRGFFMLALACVIWLALQIPPAHGQKEFHGADSVFEKQGVAMIWAILKGLDEDHSWVYIRIIKSGSGPLPFQSYSVEAIDPFTNEKEQVVKKAEWEKESVVKATRSSFKDKPGRRILFYKGPAGTQEKPAMAVFYMSIPDTTPEFLTEKQLEEYFGRVIERLKKH
jgi:hypothetical protein